MQNTVTKTNSAEILEKAIQRYRERGIILPTFKQQRNPELIPDKIKVKLQNIGLWELNPLNLFRISWKNEPVEKGGLFGSGCPLWPAGVWPGKCFAE